MQRKKNYFNQQQIEEQIQSYTPDQFDQKYSRVRNMRKSFYQQRQSQQDIKSFNSKPFQLNKKSPSRPSSNRKMNIIKPIQNQYKQIKKQQKKEKNQIIIDQILNIVKDDFQEFQIKKLFDFFKNKKISQATYLIQNNITEKKFQNKVLPLIKQLKFYQIKQGIQKLQFSDVEKSIFSFINSISKDMSDIDIGRFKDLIEQKKFLQCRIFLKEKLSDKKFSTVLQNFKQLQFMLAIFDQQFSNDSSQLNYEQVKNFLNIFQEDIFEKNMKQIQKKILDHKFEQAKLVANQMLKEKKKKLFQQQLKKLITRKKLKDLSEVNVLKKNDTKNSQNKKVVQQQNVSPQSSINPQQNLSKDLINGSQQQQTPDEQYTVIDFLDFIGSDFPKKEKQVLNEKILCGDSQAQKYLNQLLKQNKISTTKSKKIQEKFLILKKRNLPPLIIINQNKPEQKSIQAILMPYKEQLQANAYRISQTYLIAGKVKKAKQILKQQLGKKKYQSMLPQLNKIKQISNLPVEGSIKLRHQNGIDLYLLPTQKSPKKYKSHELATVLVVGMTGVGKSTYLNALVNKLMEVQPYDPFRYVIIDDGKANQSKSVTKDVTTYLIKKTGNMRKHLVLIDVPGLGDTEGVQKDNQNLMKIKEKLDSQVSQINLVLYIFKASDTRITLQCQYVIARITGIFSKNIIKNFLFILTFADMKEPVALSSLKQKFSSIIHEIGPEWYLKVNSSAVLQKINVEDPIELRQFQIGMLSVSKTLQKLQITPATSLQQSLSVMKHREKIQNFIKKIQQRVQISLVKQQAVRKLTIQISNKTQEALGQSNYTIVTQVSQVEWSSTNNNTTSCLNCKMSCHQNCLYKDDYDKDKCIAMKDGKCIVCPKKCEYQVHTNDHKIYKYVKVKKTTTNKELLKKYNISINEKNKKEALLLNMMQQYVQMQESTQTLIIDLLQSNKQLRKLQLMPIKNTTIIQYIEQLIRVEYTKKEEGYMDRITQYQRMQLMERNKQKLVGMNTNKQIQQSLTLNRIQSMIPDEKVKRTFLDKFQEKIKSFFGLQS